MKLTREEIEFLDNVLGHINYDKEEADVFWSVYAKLKVDRDKVKPSGLKEEIKT